MKAGLRHIILLWLLALPFGLFAEEKESLDVKSFIFGHTGDSYCFHITEIHGEPVCVWLPVIARSKETGWHLFSSKHVCELKEGETCTEEEINRFCLDMPRYKRPRRVIFAKVPRNPTGKIEKPLLRNTTIAAPFLKARRAISRSPCEMQGLTKTAPSAAAASASSAMALNSAVSRAGGWSLRGLPHLSLA